MDKLVLADKLTGKLCKVKLKPDSLCVSCGTSEELYDWLGFGSKRCYPITPERYSKIIQLFRPRWGGLGAEGYILSDTVRIVESVLMVFSPKGAGSNELVYDIREGFTGIVHDNSFVRVEIVGNPTCVDTIPRFCYLVGAVVLDKTKNTVRVIQIMTEAEYAAYLRALTQKKPDLIPWEILERRVAICENALSEAMQELSKLGELSAVEIVQNAINRVRQIMGAIDTLRAPQQRQQHAT